MVERFPVATHYESDIAIGHEGDATTVTKRYRTEHPCVAWLNERLAEWYDPALGLPVAQHEWAAYALLAPHGIVPTPLRLLPDAIVVAWGGTPLSADSSIAESDYRAGAERVLATFAATGFRHNDLLEGNVLIDGDQVRIIDFTLAEFGAVEMMTSLPDPGWARVGQDALLLDHLVHLRQTKAGHRRRGRLARLWPRRLPWTAN